MQAKLVVPVLSAVALCLAGCGHSHLNDHGGSGGATVNGGGGGGGSIAVPFVAANTPPSSPASFGAASAPAGFTTGGGFVTGFATPNPADSGNGATVNLTTDASGNLATIRVIAPTGVIIVAPSPNTTTFDKTLGAANGFSGPLTLAQLLNVVQQQFLAVTSAGDVTYIYQGTETGLTHASYGAWLQNNGSGNFAFGPVAFGVETTANQMLALAGTGAATYTGSTFGLGATNGTPFAVTGTATINANFTSGAVTTTLSGFATGNLSGVGSAIALPNVSGTGTIGAGVNTNQYATSLAGGAFTGNLNGTFYGNTAQETAGVWRLTNGAGTSAVGSFGAHK